MLRLRLSLFHVAPLVAILATQTCAWAEDPGIKVESRSIENGQAVSISLSDYVSEATAIFTADIQNMIPSKELPCVIEVTEPLKDALVFKQANTHYPWSCQYNYKWHVGVHSDLPTDRFLYELPFAKGLARKVSQGYMGGFSHQPGTESEYAVDFPMPEGSTVCAARDGIVVGCRENSDEGGSDAKYSTSANYIVIKHSDGTYGWYVHLKKNGAKVKLGQSVQTGERIGLSGATGQATEPHLHFDVSRISETGLRKTVPVMFSVAGNGASTLQEGGVYSH